ncbi:MAG: flagellar export chaperone FliS [Candidatus Poribacteria bacterium]|nr:flagellar export chaperone FliS [Candidatus Poribacteria bacterium]
MASSYGKYQQMQVKTADGGTLILMLYDGAILALKHTQKLMNTKPLDRETLTNQIIKARNIIYELAASLNLEAGGEIAKALLNLYGYFIWRIGRTDIEKNPDYLDDVLEHLQSLKEAWVTVFQDACVQQNSVASSGIPQSTLSGSRAGSSIVA